jgi:ankyrin repeat protein
VIRLCILLSRYSKKILAFLADAGADVNIKNNEQWAPLHISVRKGYLEAVESLINVRTS